MKDKETYEIFGLTEPYYCGPYRFWKEFSPFRPDYCGCAKFTSDNSCVPEETIEAWYTYMGIKIKETNNNE